MINPPFSSRDFIADPFWGPPLGLAYLAAVARQDGHELRIVDALGVSPLPVRRSGDLYTYGLDPKTVVDRAREFQPELVGIACPFSMSTRDALQVARLLKREYDRGVPIVMGGAYASVAARELLSSQYVDMVVVGEGEATFRDLCEVLGVGRAIQGIDGLLTSGDGEVTGNAWRERIADLDSLPLPARDLLPMRAYSEIDSTRRRVNDMRLPKTSMITSRGCPENCVFCAIRCVWGRRWIARSAESVVDEIEMLVEEHGIREVNFLDDSLTTSRNRIESICELIISRGIDIRWVPSSGVIIRTLDEGLLRLMKRSGCYRLSFGLETGDPDTKKYVRKNYDFERARRVIRYANRIGIWTTGTFIVGLPFETRDQMERTIRFAVDSGVDFAFFYCASPFLGTDLYETYLEEGIDIPADVSLMRGVPSLTMTANEIMRVRNEASRRFVRSRLARPWKPLTKIRSLEDLRYALRVAAFAVRSVRPPA